MDSLLDVRTKSPRGGGQPQCFDRGRYNRTIHKIDKCEATALTFRVNTPPHCSDRTIFREKLFQFLIDHRHRQISNVNGCRLSYSRRGWGIGVWGEEAAVGTVAAPEGEF
jgi:hypothetical protein